MILQMRLFEEDQQLVDKPLLSHVTLVSTQEQKNFYDLLHFSPLKVSSWPYLWNVGNSYYIL